MNAVHDFIASLISDPVMREPALSVFSALPEGVQEEFMGDPGFVIGMYDTAPRAFAHYVIAHELAHALLRNRGRHPEEDPEVAADSLAAAWGFPRPATLPLLEADPGRNRLV